MLSRILGNCQLSYLFSLAWSPWHTLVLLFLRDGSLARRRAADNHVVNRSRTCGIFQMDRQPFRLGYDRRYRPGIGKRLHP